MKLRTRLTYANVMATIAVFLAVGGTSYAALKITGKQVVDHSLTGGDIRDASLTTRQIKDRSLLAKDFKTGQLRAGAQGPQGAKGDAGAPGSTGPRGVSAFDPLPSGKTIVSTDYFAYDTPATVHVQLRSVAFPMRVPVGVDSSTVNFAPDGMAATTDDDPTCTGSYANPTAPAGKVCIYILGLDKISNVTGEGSLTPSLQGLSFYVQFTPLPNSAIYGFWSWAYTAP